MTRFLQWRKMTWVIAAWSGGVLAWLLLVVLRTTDAAAGCVTDSAGAALNVVTKQNCLDAAGGSGLEVVLVVAVWLLGLAVLSAVWFMTRPLWRQGYGVRLRRLRQVPRGDL